MAALLWLSIRLLGEGMSEEALSPASIQVFGVLAHGLGHMTVGLSPKSDPMTTGLDRLHRDLAVGSMGYFFLQGAIHI